MTLYKKLRIVTLNKTKIILNNMRYNSKEAAKTIGNDTTILGCKPDKVKLLLLFK